MMSLPQVTSGALLQCSFGMAPATLTILPANRVTAGGMPSATVMDTIPIVNIAPFGACQSMSNPTVAAATSAALGVLTPMPCIPVPVGPWDPGTPTVTIGGAGFAGLDTGCKLTCAWAGQITITLASQFTVTTP